ncbi:MAG: hypothetical protein JXA10_03905 [Anaerolineae bacterium]|nr:hypothetical protein [Anaerolineae bacterium]
MRMRLTALLVVITAGVAGGYGGYDMWTSEPNEIRLYVDLSSPVVTTTETFTLEVEVENVDVDAQTAVQVNAVGLDSGLLDHFIVTEVTMNGTPVNQTTGNWSDYTLDQALAGGSKLKFQYTLRAIRPGTFTGKVSVWVDSEMIAGLERSKARTETIRIQVQ